MTNRVFIGMLLAGVWVHVHAQPLGERVGPQFPYLSTNARAAAMGDASGSLLGGFTGAQSNPATLAFLLSSSVDYSFNRVLRGVSLQHLGGAFKGGSGVGFAASVDILHFGDFDFYSDAALRDRGFELSGWMGFGLMVGEDLSAGIAVRFYNATTDTQAVWGVAGDLGFSYAPGRHYRFGVAVRDMGSDYEVGNHVLVPDRTGSRLPRVLALGVAFEYPVGPRGGEFIAAFENEKIFGERGILYKLGLEYRPARVVSFRVGSKVRGNSIEPAAGLGLGIGSVGLDYAYKYSRRDAQPSHVITLGISW